MSLSIGACATMVMMRARSLHQSCWVACSARRDDDDDDDDG
jgi:hypothetical protein